MRISGQTDRGRVPRTVAGSRCRRLPRLPPSSRRDDCKVADGVGPKDHLAGDNRRMVVAIAADYSTVLAPATTFGKNFLPRVAALLDRRTDIRRHRRSKRPTRSYGRFTPATRSQR